jgi:hypothetical protein
MLEVKDLPEPGVRPSPFQAKQIGRFHGDSIRFNNDQPLNHESNQAAIQYVLKPHSSELLAKLKAWVSPNGLEQLQYTRALFLTRMGEFEDPDADIPLTELRNNLLKTSEDSYRGILKNLQLEEEVSHVLEKIEGIQAREIERAEQAIDDCKAQLAKIFEAA